MQITSAFQLAADTKRCGHLITDADRGEHLPEVSVLFKKALKVPVIVASQHDPVKSDKNIQPASSTSQHFGRQLFIDPEYPNKIMEGRANDIKRCKNVTFVS